MGERASERSPLTGSKKQSWPRGRPAGRITPSLSAVHRRRAAPPAPAPAPAARKAGIGVLRICWRRRCYCPAVRTPARQTQRYSATCRDETTWSLRLRRAKYRDVCLSESSSVSQARLETTRWARKRGHALTTNCNRFTNFFTGRFLSKFAVKWIF